MSSFDTIRPYIVGYELSPSNMPEVYEERYHITVDKMDKEEAYCIYCGHKNEARAVYGSLLSRDRESLDHIIGRFGYFCYNCGKPNNQYDKIWFEVQCKCCEKYTTDYALASHLSDSDYYEKRLTKSKNGLHEHIQYDLPECVGDYDYPKVDGLKLKRYKEQVNTQQS